jgi:hypothetical protein
MSSENKESFASKMTALTLQQKENLLLGTNVDVII